ASRLSRATCLRSFHMVLARPSENSWNISSACRGGSLPPALMRSTSRCSHCSANASYTRARRIEGRPCEEEEEEAALSLGRIDRMRFSENGSRTMSPSAGNERSSLWYLAASHPAALYSLC